MKELEELQDMLNTTMREENWEDRIEGMIAEAIVNAGVAMLKDKVTVEAVGDMARYVAEKVEQFRAIVKSLPFEEQMTISIIMKALWRRRMMLCTDEESAKAQAAAEVARFFTRGSEQLRKHPSAN